MQPSEKGATNASEPQCDTTRSFSGDSEKSVPILFPAGPLPLQVGRFQVRKKLGQGGYGCVYLAYDPTLEREIALKLPRHQGFWTAAQSHEFLKEARIAARLKHPHVITIYDADICDEHGIFIAMEHVAGETLAHRLRRGKLSIAETVRLGGQIAEAIHQGHKLGLVHRDLKPANILLDEAGNVKVCDFGLAIDENSLRSEHRDFSGTWPYMSPEQFEGNTQRLDGRSDLWSLGVVLYECLAGRRPFRGETWEEIRQQVLTLDPKPLRQLDDAIPPELDALCLRCLRRDVTQRIPTALDVGRGLTAIRTVVGRRRPQWKAAGGLLVAGILVAGVAALAIALGERLERPAQDAALQLAALPGAEAMPHAPPAPPADAVPASAVRSLLRPVHNRATAWQLLPQQNGVQAETQTVDLLAFGTIAGQDVVEVDLQQGQWTGGIGLFFGHRPLPGDSMNRRQFQALVVEPHPNGGWHLTRLQYQYPLDNPEFWKGEVLASVPIIAESHRPVHLRVQLAGGNLGWIEVDETPQPALVDMSDKAAPPSQVAAGEFGLLLNHSGGAAVEVKINGERWALAPPAQR